MEVLLEEVLYADEVAGDELGVLAFLVEDALLEVADLDGFLERELLLDQARLVVDQVDLVASHVEQIVVLQGEDAAELHINELERLPDHARDGVGLPQHAVTPGRKHEVVLQEARRLSPVLLLRPDAHLLLSHKVDNVVVPDGRHQQLRGPRFAADDLLPRLKHALHVLELHLP